jgi:hypothetical protein
MVQKVDYSLTRDGGSMSFKYELQDITDSSKETRKKITKETVDKYLYQMRLMIERSLKEVARQGSYQAVIKFGNAPAELKYNKLYLNIDPVMPNFENSVKAWFKDVLDLELDTDTYVNEFIVRWK